MTHRFWFRVTDTLGLETAFPVESILKIVDSGQQAHITLTDGTIVEVVGSQAELTAMIAAVTSLPGVPVGEEHYP